jgi:hypothetical protein
MSGRSWDQDHMSEPGQSTDLPSTDQLSDQIQKVSLDQVVKTRLSKSESPQPPYRLAQERTLSLAVESQNPHSSSGEVCFSLSSGESDAEEATTSCIPTQGSKTQSKTSKDRELHKARFKKLFKPLGLRRSRSAGNSKDVPAYALFLKQELEKNQVE